MEKAKETVLIRSLPWDCLWMLMAFRLHLIFFQVVKNTAVTNDGEIAEKNVYEIDEEQIIGTLRSMKMTLLNTANGYVPSYTRTEITDSLHKTFGFRTDY